MTSNSSRNLTQSILSSANIGMWAIEIDEGAEPRMYADDTMLRLLGADASLSPEQLYHAWYDNIHPDHYATVTDAVNRMIAGEHAEVQYPWFHGNVTTYVRCGGIRDTEYTCGVRLEGCHQDVTELAHIQKQYDELRETSEQETILHRRRADIIDALSDAYESIYHVNLEKNTFVVYKRSDYLLETYHDADVSFSEGFRAYIDMDVHPDDREMMYRVTDPTYIMQQIETIPRLHTMFRDIHTGEPQYYEMRILRPKDYDTTGNVIICFQNRQESTVLEARQREVMQRNYDIIEILASEYTSVYYIDLTTDELVPYTMNEETEHQFGVLFKNMTYSDAFRMYVDTLIFPADKPMMLRAGSVGNIMRELRTKKTFITTYRSDNNGHPHYCEMKFVKVGDEAGTPRAVALGFADKDDELRHQIEQETIRRRNTEIIEILASEYTSVYYIDLTTGELDPYTMSEEIESEFGQIFRSGIRYTEAFHLYVDTIVYHDDRTMMLKAGSIYNILEELKDKKTFITTYRESNGDEPKYCEMKFVKVGDDENPQAVALGFSIVDEAYRRELEIKQREAFIHGLADDYEAVFHVDADTGRIESIRITDAYLSRYPALSAESDYTEYFKLIAAVISAEDREAFLSNLTLEHISSVFENENAFFYNHSVDIDGVITYYQLKIIHIGDWKNDHNFLVGFHNMDKLTRAQLEQSAALDLALTEAESANVAKTTFLFNMSHDIRTPMNAIIGFTTMAQKHINDTERVADCLGKVRTASEHLLSLINDVLDMSRIESGKIVIEEHPVDLSACLRDLQNMIANSAKEKGIELVMDTGANVRHNWLFIDELRVNRVLINILNNAVKYTENGGQVRFSVSESASQKPGCVRCRFTIADNGIGMSEDFLTHVFDPFSREQSSTVSGIQGTGLGLSITRELVELMGGSIGIDSKLGKGTTVTVDLDFRIADKAVTTALSDAVNTSCLNGLQVLLVEDNDLNREIAKDILEELGMTVDEANDGTVAVKKCADLCGVGKPLYDIVLMDIQMPVMDGYKATAEIRRLTADRERRLPIIAMTANAFAEDRQRALEAGMDAHLAKPIDTNELVRALSAFAQ